MDYGYTVFGDRLHILAEELPPRSQDAGVSLCGIVLRFQFMNPALRKSWMPCVKCETLLSAMAGV